LPVARKPRAGGELPGLPPGPHRFQGIRAHLDRRSARCANALCKPIRSPCKLSLGNHGTNPLRSRETTAPTGWHATSVL